MDNKPGNTNVVSMIHWTEANKHKRNAKQKAHADALWLYNIEVETGDINKAVDNFKKKNGLPDIIPW